MSTSNSLPRSRSLSVGSGGGRPLPVLPPTTATGPAENGVRAQPVSRLPHNSNLLTFVDVLFYMHGGHKCGTHLETVHVIFQLIINRPSFPTLFEHYVCSSTGKCL